MPPGPDAKPQPQPSQRKWKGLARLQGLPVKVSQGEGYELEHHLIAGVTLDRVRQDLSAIQGSLADAVVAERAR